jgi:sialidase-1
MISYRVDNQNFRTLNLHTKWSNYLHLPWYLILADGLKNGKHVVEVNTIPGKNDSGGTACRIVYFLVNQQ